MSSIKTPDQKLRVFISSTIEELANERKAAAEAISKLRLTPVMFELGARPHPPRNLYKAYLEQSQIFVGIYWNSYGWVAPDMDISGLEDEYQLAIDKPKLIYIKKTSAQRSDRLETLILQIQGSNSVSYRKFSELNEFVELLENDLALLMSERFFEEDHKSTAAIIQPKCILPTIRDSFIGRESELERLKNMIEDSGTALVTISGPGGTGKTRLALQLAEEMGKEFKDGAWFIPLAAISDPESVAATIANHLGLFDGGKQPIKLTLMGWLRDKQGLLILDNFEQILDAALLVSELIETCGLLKILVTSRSALHIRGEFLFPLDQLKVPERQTSFSSEEIKAYPAVELFIQRVKEINPNFSADEDSLHSIGEICQRLDGLPLAIELAAVRTQSLSVGALLQRMDRSLNILTKGSRDMPARQQTLRSAIDWSYNLMDEASRQWFRRMAIFSEGWTLESAESLMSDWPDSFSDSLTVMDRLVDLGLIRLIGTNGAQRNGEPRYYMLQTVREFALEKLEQAGEKMETLQCNLEHITDLLDEISPLTWSANPSPVLNQIESDYQNVQNAFQYAVDTNQKIYSWRIIGSMGGYWISRGRHSEAMRWIEKAGIELSIVQDPGLVEQIGLANIGKALYSSGMVNQYLPKAVEIFKESAKIFESLGEGRLVARVKTFLGVTQISTGDMEAVSNLYEAIELGKKYDDKMAVVSSMTFIVEGLQAMGRMDEAVDLLTKAEQIANSWGSAFGLGITSLQRGVLLFAKNEFKEASVFYERALNLFGIAGMRLIDGWAWLCWGCCLLELGDINRGSLCFNNGLNIARETGDKPMTLISFACFSYLASKSKEKLRAAKLLGAMENLLSQSIGFGVWNSSRKVRELAKRALEDVMEPEEIVSSMAAGHELNFDQAIALALSNQAE